MINVGISGCDNLRAAELVRILINHPDVELRWVTSAMPAGTRLDQIVPGIVGECELVTTDKVSFDDVNVVFMCDSRDKMVDVLDEEQVPQDVHIIDLSGSHNLDHSAESTWTYGLSEMQRRVLVHDAHLVTVPGNAALASLLALMPLARNLLLNSPLTLHVAMGTAAFPIDTDMVRTTQDGLDATQWIEEQRQEVALALSQCQASFNQPIDMTIAPLAEHRTLAVAARFKCAVSADMIKELYEQYYHDHNFVFMVDRPFTTADVENTNKCLIRLIKDEQRNLLTVHAVMDALLKGSAGTAVHAMNLLFGLHERVGLALKGTG